MPYHPPYPLDDEVTTYPVSPWIAVADRLPPEFVKVLTWGPWRYQVDQIDSKGGQLGYGATHWMPLPEPPELPQ